MKFINVNTEFLELEQITNNKINYVIDDEEEDFKCEDIDIYAYDLTE